MKNTIVLFIGMMFYSCSLNLEAPCENEFGRKGFISEPSSVCLINMSSSEKVYAEKVLKLLGRNYTGVSIEFFSAAQEVTQQYRERYAIDCPCKTGYNTRESDIYTIPLALPHELTHTDIRDRTNWLQEGETHDIDSGWTLEDTERVRWIKTVVGELVPYAENECG